MSAYTIPEATGASIRSDDLMQTRFFPITDFGASPQASPTQNTRAVNRAIKEAAAQGGTVVFPRGTFYVYTILLSGNVNLFLEEGAVISAAKTDITKNRRSIPMWESRTTDIPISPTAWSMVRIWKTS